MSNPGDSAAQVPSAEVVRRLEIRQREQIALLRHLQRQEQLQREKWVQLAALNRQLTQQAEALRQREERWETDKAAFQKSLADQVERVAKRQQAAAETEAEAARRQEIARQMPELKELQKGAADRDNAAQHGLKQMIQRLRAQRAEADEERSDTQSLQRQVESLSSRLAELEGQVAEVAALRQQLEERNAQVAELQAYCDRAAEQRQAQAATAQTLRARDEEITRLRGELQAQPARIAELQTSPQEAVLAQVPPDRGPPAEVPALDMRSYETELDEFRRDLAADRLALDQQLRRLPSADLSPEWAGLARQREQLNRLRDEIRVAMEKLRREGDVFARPAERHRGSPRAATRGL